MSSGSAMPTFSDSSDDIGILANFAKGASSRHAATKRKRETSSSENDEDPDWVRDFTPRKRKEDMDEKEAFLASIEDDDDDESIIDLTLQDAERNENGTTGSREEQGEEVKEDAAEQSGGVAPSGKRGRGGTKPKSRLPLVVGGKLDESLVLLQSVDRELDLSGDIGAVGRVKMHEGSMFLDMKGVIYRTSLYGCNTVCVVNVGEDEARITAVLDEAVTLECERNLFGSDEIVVHGDVDGEKDGSS